MSFLSQPAANLHSPGAIGDVTPDVVNATVVRAKTASGVSLLLRSSANVDMIELPSSGSAIILAGGIRLPDDDGNGIFTGAYAANIRFNGGKQTMKANGTINIAAVPTSASGLVSGDIYSNAGILTIVP